MSIQFWVVEKYTVAAAGAVDPLLDNTEGESPLPWVHIGLQNGYQLVSYHLTYSRKPSRGVDYTPNC